MPRRQNVLGFSLLELVTIIVVLGALAFFALPRLRPSDASLLTSRDTIVAALSHGQQAAMARSSASNPITVVVNSTSIDVQESGVSIDLPNINYPIALPNGVTVTAGTGTLQYDKLGRTSATSISLNSGGAMITVEASGYAH
jgi:MSHA pilin protein MshC